LSKSKKVPDSDKINIAGFNILVMALADKIGMYLTGKED
jgi:hypothetical protein